MPYAIETVSIHAGCPNDPLSGAVNVPIHQSTTFAQSELAGDPEYCYARTGHPSREALEASLAALEGGAHGLAFASGLAAANAVLQTLSSGDHVVASRDLYGGCYRLFTRIFSRFGVGFSLIDTTRPANVERAISPHTRLLWLETPSNPLLRLTDIAACTEIAHRSGVATLVDNTFATPVFQRPLDLGADIVLHSTTKYIGGHCDVLGGTLITNDASWHERLKFVQNATGATPAPFDIFLLLRGIRTLSLRVQQHERNAAALADHFERSPHITRTIYPGLPSHPQHELAKRQTSGFGGIVSAELEGGFERARQFVRELKLWTLAESLGGVKSLLCHPATMTHAAVEPAERERIGIGDGLLRFSVGLESADDLIHDIDRALERSAGASSSSSSRSSAKRREEVAA